MGKNSDYTRAWRKKKRQENPEAYNVQRRIWEANEKARNPEKYMQRRRDTAWRCSLKRLYGITEKIFYQMLENQNGLCKVCQLPFANGERPAVDHKHATGEVRGLVHKTPCNIIIGYVEKYGTIVDCAKKYLIG